MTAVVHTIYPSLSDNNYLLLIDARTKSEYNESHVVTSKKAPKDEEGNFAVPYDAELECKQHVVVYDGNTRDFVDAKDETPAIECGKLLWENRSKNRVKILKGGYEDFSALYPFLRTQKIIFMPRELDELKTYPLEIIPGLLYIGNLRQGSSPYIYKDLKIKLLINCTIEQTENLTEEGPSILHIPVADDNESDLYSKFQTACEFIDEQKEKKQVVLIYSDLGISRSATLALAYLMYQNKTSLQEAYEHTKKCCLNLRPNRGFIEQLSQWEEHLVGQKITDIADPNF